MGVKHVGARVARLEDSALLTGNGRFTDDIKIPGMVHACFVRSSHAHARILGIDVEDIRKMPGVLAVYTVDDLPGLMSRDRMPMLVPNTSIAAMRTQHCLAKDEVCYVGQAMAVVIATTRHLAEDAANAVFADLEPLPAVSDCVLALQAGSPATHADLPGNVASNFVSTYGDVDAAFSGAAHVFRETMFQHRGGGMAIETRCVVANYDRAADLLTVWAATQTPHIARRMLSDLIGRSVEKIRVVAPDVGGGFGPKAIYYPEEAVIAATSLMLGLPVKWTEDRREHFMCATQERDQHWDVEIAVDKDARIRGVRGTMLHDSGAFMPWGIIMPYIASTTVPGPYVVPAYKLDVTVVLTNKVATTPVRGAGRPQAVFAMERLLDRVARELSIDTVEVRRRNLIQPEQMPYSVGLIFRDGKPLIYDSGDYPKAQEAAVSLSGYAGFKERQKSALQAGKYLGIGIANYVEGSGLGPFEGVTIRVQPNGKIAVATGATNQGQGTRTTLTQIVADHLDCSIDDIEMTIGDTSAIANGVGAFASRQAVNAGSSAMIAAKAVRARVVTLAAKALGVEEDDIVVDNGRASAKGGNKPEIGFGDLARITQGMPGFAMAPGDQPGLEHTAYFTPPQATYCSGTHVVEVEVDIDTGNVHIVNYTVAHDSGTIINPLVVDGQVQGGVAHGIGNALFEFMRYDENAQPLTVTFADYLLPMATDVPTCRIAHVETPSPHNPLGVKGAGEGGTIPAPAAIISAIENALAPFGVHFAETPLTPERIVEKLEAAGAYREVAS
ncbi:MAG: carbon monoxide dehydrogenase large subunit [Hyphomicrobiales bacterium]|nr:carbon monoxide dehydrogenase large subunit [Hyphomicrobiales bacterium]